MISKSGIRISIDGYVASEAFGGFISYIRSLSMSLSSMSDVTVILAVPGGFSAKYLDDVLSAGVSLAVGDNAAPVTTLADERDWRAVTLPSLLNQTAPDIHIGPAFFLPSWNGPMLVTVHDLLFETSPDLYSAPVREHLTSGLEEALRRASGVLCVSEFTASELRSRRQIDIPTTVTPLAPSEVLFRYAESQPKPPSVDPVILNVGGVHKRKRLDVLIDAFDQICATPPGEGTPRLVIVGGQGDAELEARRQRATFPERIELTAILDVPGLAERYREASVFAYPSEYEGFGLTPLEAMLFGVPTVAWKNSAQTNNLQGAAVLLERQDATSLARAISDILNDEDAAATYSRVGRTRALGYSWTVTAQRTLQEAMRAIDS